MPAELSQDVSTASTDRPHWDTGRKKRRATQILAETGERVSLAQLSFDDPDFPHGDRYGYVLGCRCAPCRAAERNYKAAWRRKAGKVDPSKPVRPRGPVPLDERMKNWVHGKRSTYIMGCRCDECTQANREYQRPYMRMARKGVRLEDPMMQDLLP